MTKNFEETSFNKLELMVIVCVVDLHIRRIIEQCFFDVSSLNYQHSPF